MRESCRQADIGQYDVGLQARGALERALEGARLADHLQVTFQLQECTQSFAEDRVIVDQEQRKAFRRARCDVIAARGRGLVAP